ncbi:hypothetical protein RND71_012750 [Anisodus tanguticus]|uniref:Uncharacterized protein n=1 Tax=Anisodus tanguticus TaxID=243964 RepID=A0AAE1SGF7_9SOLA|nr:hypothetical protein RND71_012750 [Anisodus tanguticus]
MANTGDHPPYQESNRFSKRFVFEELKNSCSLCSDAIYQPSRPNPTSPNRNHTEDQPQKAHSTNPYFPYPKTKQP